VRTLTFVADQQALAMHDLHQAQHGAVGDGRLGQRHRLVHLLGRGGTERPQCLQQIEFGCRRFRDVVRLGHAVFLLLKFNMAS
jgi:hypothetical protein